MIHDDGCVASSVTLGGSESSWARYWDDTATVEELKFDVELPANLTDAASKDAKPKKKKESTKGRFVVV